jgi:hypothetical protein
MPAVGQLLRATRPGSRRPKCTRSAHPNQSPPAPRRARALRRGSAAGDAARRRGNHAQEAAPCAPPAATAGPVGTWARAGLQAAARPRRARPRAPARARAPFAAGPHGPPFGSPVGGRQPAAAAARAGRSGAHPGCSMPWHAAHATLPANESDNPPPHPPPTPPPPLAAAGAPAARCGQGVCPARPPLQAERGAPLVCLAAPPHAGSRPPRPRRAGRRAPPGPARDP